MFAEIDWDALEKLAERASQSGESPGAVADTEWERLRQALATLQQAEDWPGILRLRKLFTGLLARDSAWGIAAVKNLDDAAIEAARRLDDAAELGHLLGARGHNLHRQGFHEESIAAFYQRRSAEKARPAKQKFKRALRKGKSNGISQ